MSRPRKGEKGHLEALAKWRATMLKKYDSEEAMHDYFVAIGRKGGKIKRDGARGFALMSQEKVRELGRRGASIRWGK